MADTEEKSERKAPSQFGRVLDRTIAHEAIGVGIPNFIGWAADWAVGLLRSGAHLMTGKLERPDFYANGPADRSMGGLAGAEGSMLIGQPLSEALGVGHVRSKAGKAAETGALNVKVSYDSGNTWDKASGPEGVAHWGGQVFDPTLALPMVAAANKLSKIGKVASAADHALNVAGMGTLGLAVGHDMILRGLILNPNEAIDVLGHLSKRNGLDKPDDIRRFNQDINFLLKEFHDPLNDKKRTTLFGAVKNKNYDPSILYLRSLDPTSEVFERTGADNKDGPLRDNYMTAAMEINKTIETSRNRIAEKKGKSEDYAVVAAGQQFDKRFNEIALRYLQQGDKVALSPADTMVLQFRTSLSTMASASPEKAETLRLLREQLEAGYKGWAQTPGGQAAIRSGVQSGAITAVSDKIEHVPTGNLSFMLAVQQNLLGREMQTTNQAAAEALKAEREKESRPMSPTPMGMWR